MNTAQKKSYGIPPEATPRRAIKRITAVAVIAPVFALAVAGAAAPVAAYASKAPASKAPASDGYRGRLVSVISLVGLLAVAGAALGGSRFVSHGTDGASMTMAILTAVALLAYAANLFILKE